MARRNNIEERTQHYEFIVVDEGRHVAATAFTNVLDQMPAQYWLGLTTTPYRRDRLEKHSRRSSQANHTAFVPN